MEINTRKTEEKLIKELKSKNLIPGKIKRINLIEKTLSQNFLRANIQPDTVVILVFKKSKYPCNSNKVTWVF